MVNLRREMQVRGLKPAFGPMAKTRNKRMLLKAVEDEDKAIMETFQVGDCALRNNFKACFCYEDAHVRSPWMLASFISAFDRERQSAAYR